MGCRWNRLDEAVFVAVSFFGLTGIVYIEKFYALCGVFKKTTSCLKILEALRFLKKKCLEFFRPKAKKIIPLEFFFESVKKHPWELGYDTYWQRA